MPLYLGKTDKKWAEEFQARMNKLRLDSPDYEKCRKIFAFLCNRIRAEERSDYETIKKQLVAE